MKNSYMKKKPGKLSSQSEKVRIFVVDDHPIVRQGITQMINQEKDMMVCGDAEEAYQALDRIRELNPDIVIVDISLKGTNGIELIKALKLQNPSLPIMVLSMHDESLYAERVLRAGARGYVMKQEATGNVLVAIRRVLGGEICVSEKISTQIMEKCVTGSPSKLNSPMDSLSDRELEVFQLIGKGHGTRQIAKDLHLSVKTVETYREHIKEKLKLENATELVRHAVQWVEGGSSD